MSRNRQHTYQQRAIHLVHVAMNRRSCSGKEILTRLLGGLSLGDDNNDETLRGRVCVECPASREAARAASSQPSAGGESDQMLLPHAWTRKAGNTSRGAGA